MFIIEQKEEFLRTPIGRQTLVASGFALTIATLWGFLENFGLVAHVDAYWWMIVWCVGLVVGSIFNKITLGAAGSC